jgi:hypothetical protein
MSYCKICGSERGVEYRERSGMALCASCHEDTPQKVGFDAFLDASFRTEEPAFPRTYGDRAMAREFYEDYKASRHSSASEYWASCGEVVV